MWYIGGHQGMGKGQQLLLSACCVAAWKPPALVLTTLHTMHFAHNANTQRIAAQQSRIRDKEKLAAFSEVLARQADTHHTHNTNTHNTNTHSASRHSRAAFGT